MKELGQRRMTGFRLNWKILEEHGTEVKITTKKKYTKVNVNLVKMVNLVNEAGKQGILMEKVWSVVQQYTVVDRL